MELEQATQLVTTAREKLESLRRQYATLTDSSPFVGTQLYRNPRTMEHAALMLEKIQSECEEMNALIAAFENRASPDIIERINVAYNKILES